MPRPRMPGHRRPAGGSLSRWGLADVHGGSMLPTLRDGDRLLVRHGAAPRVGALVVVRLPRRRGSSERVLAVKRATRREPGGWWVECERPGAGEDSWTVGPVADDEVVAVVRARIWPLRRVTH